MVPQAKVDPCYNSAPTRPHVTRQRVSPKPHIGEDILNQQNISNAEQAYRNLGVTPIINASGSVTRLGGSRTPARGAGADGRHRPRHGQHRRAQPQGRRRDRPPGGDPKPPWSAVARPAASCSRPPPASPATTPTKCCVCRDTEGMKNEIIMQTMHRFPYDHAYRAVGAKIVEIGNYLFNHPWELGGRHQRADRRPSPTCAPPFTSKRVMPLAQVCRDRPRPRRAGDRRRRLHAAAPGQPAPLPARRRGHGDLQRRQRRSRAPGHRHPLRPAPTSSTRPWPTPARPSSSADPPRSPRRRSWAWSPP